MSTQHTCGRRRWDPWGPCLCPSVEQEPPPPDALVLADVLGFLEDHLHRGPKGIVGGCIRYSDGSYEIWQGASLDEERLVFEGTLLEVLLEAKRRKVLP
jgi:hypothetical protein